MFVKLIFFNQKCPRLTNKIQNRNNGGLVIVFFTYKSFKGIIDMYDFDVRF